MNYTPVCVQSTFDRGNFPFQSISQLQYLIPKSSRKDGEAEVNIGDAQSVDALKDAIKAAKPNELRNVDAKNLEL